MGSEQTGTAGSESRTPPGFLWLPPATLAAVILLLSSTPGSYYPEHPNFLNNLAHFLEFFLLGLFLARAFYWRYFPSSLGLFTLTTAVCVSFGLLDELHQFFVPQRMFDIMDVTFDLMGAAAGSLVYIAAGLMKTPVFTGNVDD